MSRAAAAALPPQDKNALLVALSELATKVQRARTVDAVLAAAASGLRALGLHLVVVSFDGDDIVLEHIAVKNGPAEALEKLLGRGIKGMRGPIEPDGHTARLRREG